MRPKYKVNDEVVLAAHVDHEHGDVQIPELRAIITRSKADEEEREDYDQEDLDSEFYDFNYAGNDGRQFMELIGVQGGWDDYRKAAYEDAPSCPDFMIGERQIARKINYFSFHIDRIDSFAIHLIADDYETAKRIAKDFVQYGERSPDTPYMFSERYGERSIVIGAEETDRDSDVLKSFVDEDPEIGKDEEGTYTYRQPARWDPETKDWIVIK